MLSHIDREESTVANYLPAWRYLFTFWDLAVRFSDFQLSSSGSD
jgi:hypothetical protein